MGFFNWNLWNILEAGAFCFHRIWVFLSWSKSVKAQHWVIVSNIYINKTQSFATKLYYWAHAGTGVYNNRLTEWWTSPHICLYRTEFFEDSYSLMILSPFTNESCLLLLCLLSSHVNVENSHLICTVFTILLYL